MNLDDYDKIPISVKPSNIHACQTHSGKYVDVWNFGPQDVDRYDIIASLGKICRFGGHSLKFYSVAQHSVHVAERVYQMTYSPQAALYALYHDAHEAYTGDIPRPMKYHESFADIRALMEGIQNVIVLSLGLRSRDMTSTQRKSLDTWIKNADNELLWHEAQRFMKDGGRDWYWIERPRWSRVIVPLDPQASIDLMESYDAELREAIHEEAAEFESPVDFVMKSPERSID